MKLKTTAGLFLILMISSCSQQITKREPIIDSGILIDNGINRGISYTDSLGNDYNLRYIPVTITNDSTISIRLQISFLAQYSSPSSQNNEQFRLIPLPKEWALDGIGVTESMIVDLPSYIDNPSLNETIKPGQKIVMAIGALYPRPPKFSGVLPNMLFTQDKRSLYSDCPGLTDPILAIDSGLKLGLKLKFGESCRIISCGQVAYTK